MRWMFVCAAIAAGVAIAASSCKHGRCKDGPTSSASGSSHNAGANCMRCHLPDGEGEVCWKVAGTIYDHQGGQPVRGAEVRLFTRPLGGGEVRLAIQSDRDGNIHTSEAVNFGYGLFPAVIHGTDTVFMSASIRDGACNRCHGVSTGRITQP